MSNNETFSCVSSGHLVEDRRTVETQGLIWPQYACLSAHFFVTLKKRWIPFVKDLYVQRTIRCYDSDERQKTGIVSLL